MQIASSATQKFHSCSFCVNNLLTYKAIISCCRRVASRRVRLIIVIVIITIITIIVINEVILSGFARLSVDQRTIVTITGAGHPTANCA